MSEPVQTISPTTHRVAVSTQLLDPRFVRRAGRSALLAVGTLSLSAVALALYFGGAGGIFGPINDALIAATFVLLLPAVEAVRQLARSVTGRWFDVASAAALAGLTIGALGQVLLIAGLLPLAGSFVTLGVGALLVVGWAAALAVVTLRDRVLARPVGWWAVALVAATVVTAIGAPVSGSGTAELSVVFGVPLLVATAGLLASLGRDLLRQA